MHAGDKNHQSFSFCQPWKFFSLSIADGESRKNAMNNYSLERRRGPASQVQLGLSAESLPFFVQGISLILSRWGALQLAVENGWGGTNPGQRLEQLASALHTWFAESRGPHDIEDLENTLDEFMVLSFNAEIEDGSIEEVAEQLMILYDDCLHQNYELIERMRRSNGANQTSFACSKQNGNYNCIH